MRLNVLLISLIVPLLFLGACGTVPSGAEGSDRPQQQFQFRIIESGGVQIENLTRHSVLTDEDGGFDSQNVTEPGDNHVALRRNFTGSAPNTVWLLDGDTKVARAQIDRCERPGFQSRCTHGNVRVTFYPEGFTYDHADGLRRVPDCRRWITERLDDGSFRRLCAYDRLQ